MGNIITIHKEYDEEYYKNSNKIGEITIIIERKDFDKKFVDNNKNKLLDVINNQIEHLKSEKFEVEYNIEHGSIKCLLVVTFAILVQYNDAKDGFLSFVKDVKNIEQEITNVINEQFPEPKLNLYTPKPPKTGQTR